MPFGDWFPCPHGRARAAHGASLRPLHCREYPWSKHRLSGYEATLAIAEIQQIKLRLVPLVNSNGDNARRLLALWNIGQHRAGIEDWNVFPRLCFEGSTDVSRELMVAQRHQGNGLPSRLRRMDVGRCNPKWHGSLIGD